MFPSVWGAATTPFVVLAWNWRKRGFRSGWTGPPQLRCFPSLQMSGAGEPDRMLMAAKT